MCLYDRCPINTLLDHHSPNFGGTLPINIILTDLRKTNITLPFLRLKLMEQWTLSERGAITSTFIALKSSNSILQLERAVRALYFIGTSVRSRITRSGQRAARGVRGGAGRGGRVWLEPDRGNDLPLTCRTCSRRYYRAAVRWNETHSAAPASATKTQHESTFKWKQKNNTTIK